jgi:hypothetical protein
MAGRASRARGLSYAPIFAPKPRLWEQKVCGKSGNKWCLSRQYRRSAGVKSVDARRMGERDTLGACVACEPQAGAVMAYARRVDRRFGAKSTKAPFWRETCPRGHCKRNLRRTESVYSFSFKLPIQQAARQGLGSSGREGNGRGRGLTIRSQNLLTIRPYGAHGSTWTGRWGGGRGRGLDRSSGYEYSQRCYLALTTMGVPKRRPDLVSLGAQTVW